MKTYCDKCGTTYNDETVPRCPVCAIPPKEDHRKRPVALPKKPRLYTGSPKGSEHGSAKLTEEQVFEIRAIGTTQTWSATAAQYGVSKRVIGKILHRTAWTHI